MLPLIRQASFLYRYNDTSNLILQHGLFYQ